MLLANDGATRATDRDLGRKGGLRSRLQRLEPQHHEVAAPGHRFAGGHVYIQLRSARTTDNLGAGGTGNHAARIARQQLKRRAVESQLRARLAHALIGLQLQRHRKFVADLDVVRPDQRCRQVWHRAVALGGLTGGHLGDALQRCNSR